jgi:hypothetical protein
MQSHDYVLTLKHDNGKFRIRTAAEDEKMAKQLVMAAENCPECAIVKVHPVKKKKNHQPL